MDMVERVARAIYNDDRGPRVTSWDQLAKGAKAYWLTRAKAAIRAMLEGLEPVALILDHVNGDREFTRASARLTDADKDEGWTETPLYDLSALKEAVK